MATSFHLLPHKSSPPVSERSDCFGVSSRPCCFPHAGVIFLSSILCEVHFCPLPLKTPVWRPDQTVTVEGKCRTEKRQFWWGLQVICQVKSVSSGDIKENVTLQEQTRFAEAKSVACFDCSTVVCVATYRHSLHLNSYGAISFKGGKWRSGGGCWHWPVQVPDHIRNRTIPTLVSQGVPWHEWRKPLLILCD